MKNKRIKLISFSVMCLVLITGLFIIKYLPKSLAATTTTLPDIMTSKATDASTETVSFLGIRDSRKYLVDPNTNKEYTVYCLNKDKEWNDGANFKKSASPLNDGYSYIALNGYPNKSFTGNLKNDIYLTQIALWFYQDRSNGIGDNVDGVLTAEEKATIKESTYYTNYIENLIAGAMTAKTSGVKPEPVISVDTSNLSYTNISGKTYLVSSNININSTNPFDDYLISLNVNNYEILNQDNTVVRTVTNGTVTKSEKIASTKAFKLRVPIEELQKLSNKKITITALADYTQKDTYLYQPEEEPDEIQEVAVSAVEATAKSTSVTKELTVPTGSLTIIKKDPQGNNLKNAKILIENEYGYSYTMTTTTAPQTLTDLIPTTYTITEIEAPVGYIIDSSKNVEVVANSTKSVTMTDDEITMSVRKVDEDNPTQTVAGARIKIYKEDDLVNPVIDVKTGLTEEQNNYLIKQPLTTGTYYAKEIQAPKGYIRDTTTKTINITEQNHNITVTFKNKKNHIDIYKIDDNNNPLSGVLLAVYKQTTNELVDSWTTDGTKHTLTGLEQGTYYVKELQVPTGYILSESTEEFTVNSDGEISPSSVYFVNAKRGILINKVDENGLPVKDAELRIKNSTGTYDKTFTTTTSPLVLENLEVGTYTVTETKAPDGFVLSHETKTFTIENTTKNITVTFKNTRNKIKIAKVDENNNYIEGTKLQLTDSNDNLIETWTSGLEPHVISSLTLKHGTYKLTELEATPGYILDKTPMYITIDQNSDNEYVYTKKNKEMDISVIKKDENDKPLDEVTLELLNSNKERVLIWETTDKPYKLKNLEKGTYYVREVSTKEGYILDKTLHKLVIDDSTTTKTIEIVNKPIIVEIAKIDSNTNEYIDGAILKLSTEDGTEIETWTTTKDKKIFKQLKEGKYILEEVKPKDGYISNGNKLTFEVKNTGEVQTILMKDNYVSLKVENKKLVVDTNKIEGFKFVLTTKDKVKIEEWTSTKEVHTTKELTNNTYILEILETPSGYTNLSTPFEFSVTDNNTVDLVKLVNKPITVTVSKKDFTNGKEIPGAELVLKDSSDKTIDTWTSTDKPHQISRLPKGKYKLTEIVAPSGYVLSKETVEFEVKETGDIQTAIMYNMPKVKVEDTSKNNSIIIYVIAIMLMIFGSSITIYTLKTRTDR